MFEEKIIIYKKTVRVYDVGGNVTEEHTILNDGGIGQEKAENRLKDTDQIFKDMDKIFEDMDNLFKQRNK